MRDRVYIVPSWIGLAYFAGAVFCFVWGAIGLHPLLSFLGFYLLIFFVFGALQTNENLKGLTLDAGPGIARISGTGRESRFAIRVVRKQGRERQVLFIPRLLRPLEVRLPEGDAHTRVSLTTSFPIGLFHAWKPARWQPSRFAPAPDNGMPGEVIDHREFRRGDREADIDWKRSARRGQRVIKVREKDPLALPLPSRRPGRWLVRGLLAQPLIVYWLWHSPLWLSQAVLLADLGLLWFLFSNFLFPLDETGRLTAMLASLVRVFVISVTAFALLALLSPDFLAGLFPNPRQAHIGFTRIAWMDPGQVAQVRESNELIFRARLTPAPVDVPFWRGITLEHTNNGLRWFDAAEEIRPTPSPAAKLVRQRIVLANRDAGPVALDRPVSLPTEPVPNYYEAVSDPGAQPADVPRGPLQLPREVSPELRRLADEWRRGAPDLEQFTMRARRFFHRDFHYRLDPGTYEHDGLTEFLWHRREGFCEHFAGAFATLLRLGGFPSRIVKGFKGGEQALDGTYHVRAKHAHAWVEAYSEKRHAWLRLDPTDWAGVRTGEEAPPTRWRLWSDSLAHRWEPVADHWAFFWGAFRQHAGTVARARIFPWLALWLVLGILLTMGTIARTQARERRPTEPEFAFYEEHCRQMAAQGLSRRPNEGPLDYAARCGRQLPNAAASIQAVTQKYLELRYRA